MRGDKVYVVLQYVERAVSVFGVFSTREDAVIFSQCVEERCKQIIERTLDEGVITKGKNNS